MPKYDHPPPKWTGGNTIGDYYARCDAARDHWHALWLQARADGKPPDEIEWLYRQMLEAGNTGD